MFKINNFIGINIEKWLVESFNLDAQTVVYIKTPLLILLLIAICFISWYLTKVFVVRTTHKIFLKTKVTWDDILVEKRVFNKLATIIPALIIAFAAPLILSDFPITAKYIQIVSDVFIVGVIVWIVNTILSVFREILSESENFKDKPITSYFQVVKILIYFIGGIFILSILLGKSPFYFLGAMGAMTAVLLLIFKDTILGFVASVQMSVYDMIRVGDWIAMPKYDADGDVVSINLNTVKVQNWDKTITTIPTYAFITDSFKNWRGMTDSGGRRIKRAIYLKVSSFKFCDEAMIEQFRNYALIKDYVNKKEEEMNLHNSKQTHKEAIPVNIRRLTNIGIFRVYTEKYIRANPRINKDMTIMVRQLEPTSKGLPLEIYCFSLDKEWIAYETIISDIFDHLLTITSEFNLEVFEEPTGKDFSSLNR